VDFEGEPTLKGPDVKFDDYRARTLRIQFFLEVGVTTTEGWDWIGRCYATIMSLTPLPQPWSAGAEPAAVFDESGTAGTLVTRIPANIFGRDTTADPGVHHYGPVVHLSPSTLGLIGDPRDQPDVSPSRVTDLREVSDEHGLVVQMPLSIDQQDLRAWRDYLAPVLRINDQPRQDVLDLIAAGYIVPFLPTDLSCSFVLEEDVVHPAMGTYNGPANAYDEICSLEDRQARVAGREPMLSEFLARRQHDFSLSKCRNLMVVRPEALRVPTGAAMPFWPVRNGPLGYFGADIYARERIMPAIEHHPDLFVPVLHWQRERSEQRSVKIDSWELAIFDHDGWTDTVTVAPTKSGRISVRAGKSRGPRSGRPTFYDIVDRAQAGFGDVLAEPPDPDRWTDMCTSRLDIERWLKLNYFVTPINVRHAEYLVDAAEHLAKRTGHNR